MKILLCTNAFEKVTNGPAKFAHLALGMRESFPGNELRVLTEDVSAEDPGRVYKLHLRIPRALKPSGMFLRMFSYHRRAMTIRRMDFPFDVLVYNNCLVGLYSTFRFKPTIGFINDYSNLNVRFRDWILPHRWNKALVFFPVERLAARRMDKVIVNSRYLQKLVQKRYRLERERLHVLYKSIEIASERHPRTVPEIPVVLFVKTDYRLGGLHLLIDALHATGRCCRLVIIGPPEHAQGEILTWAKGKNLQLEIKGFCDQQTVFAAMRNADIFCVPSFRESFGVANLEALALGCSVISTTAGGIPEAMDQGNCAWLVPPGDAPALTKAICECLEKADLREAKRESGYKFVQNFNIQAMMRSFTGILEA